MTKQLTNKYLIAFFIIGLISIYFGFFQFNINELVSNYTKTVYYFHSLCFFLFILCLFKAFFIKEKDCSLDKSFILDKLKRFLYNHGFAIVLSLIIMTLGLLVCKPDYRILADETNLISDSQVLYETKECYSIMCSLEPQNWNKVIIRSAIDKRPAFFPFFLSIIHSLIGYKAENAFILNFIFGSLSLFSIYYFIQLLFGRFWGICGMGCLSAFPIFLLYTNSAGFDIFNMLCSLIFFVFIFKFISNPTARFAELLLFSFLILGQSRYESIATIVIVIPLVVYFLPKSEYDKLSFKILLFPILLVPSAWLFRISSDASSWQVDTIKGGFGVEWLYKNIIQAFVFYLSGDEDFGVIPIINLIGFIGLLSFVFDFLNKKQSLPKYQLSHWSDKSYILLWISILSFYTLHLIAKFSYKLSDLTEVLASRHGIIFIPLLIIMAISIFVKINKQYKIEKPYFILSILFLIIIYWPNASKNVGIRNFDLYKEFKQERLYLETYQPNKSEYILVTNRPNLFTPFNYSSVGFIEFNKHKEEFLQYLQNQFYKYIIVICEIDKKTNKNINKNDSIEFPENFKEQTLLELTISNYDTYFRFSKISLDGYNKH